MRNRRRVCIITAENSWGETDKVGLIECLFYQNRARMTMWFSHNVAHILLQIIAACP